MKNFSWPVFILSLLGLLAFVLPGHAQAADKQTMVYEVYAGGIHAVQATLDIDLTRENRYDLVLDAHTRGFLGRLAPWNGVFQSHGWNTGNEFKPELHKSTTTWRDETEVKEYSYTRAGGFKSLVITDHGKKPRKEQVEDALTQGTTDALTATLSVLEKVAADGACEGSAEVFDGKRRFKQVFRQQGVEKLESSKYNIFEGPAIECTVEVVPVEGEWHSKPRGWMSIQEQGRKRGTMPTVWMGQLSETGPAVPVKIRVKTAYGTLFMHLAEYRNSDFVAVAEKRVTD